MIESCERESGGTSVVHQAAPTVAHPPVTTGPAESPKESSPTEAKLQLRMADSGEKHCGSTTSADDRVELLTKVAEAEGKAIIHSVVEKPLITYKSTEARRHIERQSCDPGNVADHENGGAESQADLHDNASSTISSSRQNNCNRAVSLAQSSTVLSHNFGPSSSLLGSTMATNPILPAATSGEAKSRAIYVYKTPENDLKPNDSSPGSPVISANTNSSSHRASPPVATTPSKSKSGSSLRRGKWTVEEEAYVARVIQDFNSGYLNAPAGTTLRSYLSEKLQCDPMRITKKFTGEACIGKRVFHPAVRSASNSNAIDKAQAEVEALERRWRRRLEMQQRESAKKAASSAPASTGRTHGFHTQSLSSADSPVTGKGEGFSGSIADDSEGSRNVLTQTASWLDRASTVLHGGAAEYQPSAALTDHVGAPGSSQLKYSLTVEQAEALQTLPKKELENQMKEVERLIHEGPFIQQTSAGIPHILDHALSVGANHGASMDETVSEGQQTPPEPADKRMRTGAEDAEALVGFLAAVRASATAGSDSLSN